MLGRWDGAPSPSRTGMPKALVSQTSASTDSAIGAVLQD